MLCIHKHTVNVHAELKNFIRRASKIDKQVNLFCIMLIITFIHSQLGSDIFTSIFLFLFLYLL